MVVKVVLKSKSFFKNPGLAWTAQMVHEIGPWSALLSRMLSLSD